MAIPRIPDSILIGQRLIGRITADDVFGNMYTKLSPGMNPSPGQQY